MKTDKKGSYLELLRGKAVGRRPLNSLVRAAAAPKKVCKGFVDGCMLGVVDLIIS
jgi:hypothetical protein